MQPMKTLYIVLFFCSSALFTTAQATLSDSHWLIKKYGEEGEAIVSAGGEKLAMYEYLNAQGYSVSDVSIKDISMYPDALECQPIMEGAVPLTEEMLINGSIDSELYTFDRKNTEQSYYRVGTTGYLLVIHSFALSREQFLNGQ